MASVIHLDAGLAPTNASLPTASYLSKDNGLLSSWLGGYSKAQIVITILAILVACMYLWRKGPIAGPTFKIPFMGPFIQALYPKFDAYLAQWASGPLSCVSVFHK
jgi:C-22 sterol desaturase